MLPDPVGEVTRMWTRPNGLRVGRMRIPLGVIGIVYESRPNVTVDAAALCIKAGNAVILRGGSEAFHSNSRLAGILRESLKQAGLPEDAVQFVETTDRQAVLDLLGLEEYVDVMIPRGGEDLIRFVTQNARMPVLKHYKGVCHVYVDSDADLEMARDICLNAKVQRPGSLQRNGDIVGSRGDCGKFSARNGRSPSARTALSCAAARRPGRLCPTAPRRPRRTGTPSISILFSRCA